MTDLDRVVPALRDAIVARGYSDLTPVQKAVLAPEAAGVDALVSAQTGSGKTVAFGIAIAQSLLSGDERFGAADVPRALIVAPTRELALQIRREFEWLYAATGAVIASCVGGMDMRTERRQLQRGAHIVIGTPGRLRDHIQRESLDTSSIRAVVLDEADEMLDLGFREDLEFILAATPEERQTLLFSATVARGIAALAKKYQRDAVRISTTEEKQQHSDIDYRAMLVAPNDRENAIVNILRYHEAPNALIFCGTRATVNHITARFKNRGFSVVALSGELTQSERTHALQAMRDGRARVCIATDVAARGIDLPNLELVIHADLPTNVEALLHRSGRTGRAGRKGVSTLIVPLNKRRATERLLSSAKIDATWARPPSAEDVQRRDDERLLSHDMLQAPMDDEVSSLIDKLVAQNDARQLANAFLRLAREGQSAPEELQDVVVSERSFERSSEGKTQRGQRQDFDRSVWFALSVGRKHKAEPGWLLPVLCRGGGLSKPDIGAIRVQQDHTLVEINADSAAQFEAALSDNGTLEKNIRAKRVDAPPTRDQRGSRGSFRPPGGPRKKAAYGKKKRSSADDRTSPKPDRDRRPKAATDGTGAPKRKKKRSGGSR